MADDSNPTINTALVRELVLKQGKDSKRFTKEAATATSELLRLFILEARNRASIEAECETEGNLDENGDGKALIRADHITKIAAELLMDFT